MSAPVDGTRMTPMEKNEGIDLHLGMARLAARFAWRRAGFVWKVIRGRHTVSDTAHDLAYARGIRSVWHLTKTARRLLALRHRGGTAAEVDVLRMVFEAEAKALARRWETRNFYQDSVACLDDLSAEQRRGQFSAK